MCLAQNSVQVKQNSGMSFSALDQYELSMSTASLRANPPLPSLADSAQWSFSFAPKFTESWEGISTQLTPAISRYNKFQAKSSPCVQVQLPPARVLELATCWSESRPCLAHHKYMNTYIKNVSFYCLTASDDHVWHRLTLPDTASAAVSSGEPASEPISSYGVF